MLRSLSIMFRRFVSHHWTEIRAADAHFDHVADASAAMAAPRAATNAIGKFGHFVESSAFVRHHIFAVRNDRSMPGRTERSMQNGAIFRNVELLAAKHRIDSRL
jgi:hypothetical protein